MAGSISFRGQILTHQAQDLTAYTPLDPSIDLYTYLRRVVVGCAIYVQ